jgi:hypothetical protein
MGLGDKAHQAFVIDFGLSNMWRETSGVRSYFLYCFPLEFGTLTTHSFLHKTETYFVQSRQCIPGDTPLCISKFPLQG